VLPCLIVSLLAAVAAQIVVTQLVMGAAVNLSPVAVFAVVIIGTTIAGIAGAIFAIPTAAAIFSITDYLRQRDVLVRTPGADSGGGPASEVGGSPPDSVREDA
jgi:predicted PurR-regulated permease PerM